jgi:hypothetical protein
LIFKDARSIAQGGGLLHGRAASYRRIKEYYRGKKMAEMDLPDIDLEGRVIIMTGADRGLGRAMSLGLAKRARAWQEAKGLA